MRRSFICPEPMMEPPSPHQEDHSERITPQASRGLVQFILLLVFYGSFAGFNAFAPETAAKSSVELGGLLMGFGGLNVAMVTGICLIFAAVLLCLRFLQARPKTPPSRF